MALTKEEAAELDSLRQEVAEVTAERDALLKEVARSQASEASALARRDVYLARQKVFEANLPALKDSKDVATDVAAMLLSADLAASIADPAKV